MNHDPYLLQQLAHLKKILRWKNVELELLLLSDISCTKTVYNSVDANHQHPSHGAIIINMNDNEGDCVSNKIKIDTLDNYCGKNNIQCYGNFQIPATAWLFGIFCFGYYSNTGCKF